MDQKLSNEGELMDQLLLPGIPNEITLTLICSKLSWKAFYVLSTVSSAWRQAVQSHLVYETRIGCHSTETLLVHNHFGQETAEDTNQVVALYSVRDKRCYELPRIPGVERGIPFACECVSLDGKIYVLGGSEYYDPEDDEESKFVNGRIRPDEKEVYKEVYVYDLAGNRLWTRCASMLVGRHRFACGVMNGKIYVFGGVGNRGPVGSELYDPQGNTWSPIKPMPRERFRDHRVTTLGEELAIYGGDRLFIHLSSGMTANAKTANFAKKRRYNDHEWICWDFLEEALYLEVYHPLKDEWRVVDQFVKDYLRTGTIFEARGKLHLMNQGGVSVYDGDKNSWEVLYQNSFSAIGPTESIEVIPAGTAVVNEQLFAGVGWIPNGDERAFGTCLLEGREFGSDSETIEWQILARCRCESVDFMYTMQL